MRVLVLGGTVFLGRHVAAEALARDHELTIFTRGLHPVPAGVEHLRGDRTGALDALRGRSWDMVVDTWSGDPAVVAASSELLADSVAHLVYVSSINAYPAWPAEPVDEDSEVWREGDDYGPKKVASERAAEAAMPGRVAVVRAGLLVGPHDNIFRLPWWVRRIAAGGDVVAPGEAARPVQIIDARDLAAWMLDLAERRVAGAFNGTGPIGQTTMGSLLDAAVEATGSHASLRWVPDDVLRDAGVEPWDELPLWLPADEFPGTWQVGTERARAAGLRCRPVAESVADVWAWLRAGGESELGEWGAANRPRGLTPDRERSLFSR